MPKLFRILYINILPKNKKRKPINGSAARNSRGTGYNPRKKYKRVRRKKIEIEDCK